jgi:hypothetical protein
MTDLMIIRRQRAIVFYMWLKDNQLVVNIESGVDILVNDQRAILTLDEDDAGYPEEFKNASLFFVSETGDKINVEALRWNQTFSMKNHNN